MYIPVAFKEPNLIALHSFIEQNSFGLLVSQHGDRLFATHLPFLLDRDAGTNGTLIGHMARANPQWRQLAEQTSLVVFSGPHAYISPSWYETADVVPTWNYAAVHAYGRVQVIEDQPSLMEIVQKSVAVYERSMPQPWRLDVSTYAERLLAQIVGFRIEIVTIEGKFKLNQHHPIERREKVIRALRKQGGEDAEAIAGMMQETIPHSEITHE